MWPLIHGLGKEFGENANILVMPPGIRIPGSFPYFLLVLQFGNSGGPLVNLVSGSSFPRIPAQVSVGRGGFSLIQ